MRVLHPPPQTLRDHVAQGPPAAPDPARSGCSGCVPRDAVGQFRASPIRTPFVWYTARPNPLY
ncbi:MAG: hypothetical protein GX575_17195 [Candidatus Anammoximicrobium sp.]|nr:hypothetical protein [Candidatus Anammoximicrobium sp.]